MEIKIREAAVSDASEILQVHFEAVHKTASKDYPDDILEEWSKEVDQTRFKAFVEKLKNNPENERIVVAEVDLKIAGFGAIVPEKKELRAVYVSPKYNRSGVGSIILNHLESLALSMGVTELSLDSSLTALKFYLRHGYTNLGTGTHTLECGKEMACVHMHKQLTQQGF